MRRVVLILLTLACMLPASEILAQSRGGRGEEDTLPPSVPPPISSLPPSRGIAGRRLEPGAVLCGSEEDLQQRGVVNRRRLDGEVDAGDPLAGCRILNQTRGVDVVARHGFGRVEVKLKPSGEVGWTDAYLP